MRADSLIEITGCGLDHCCSKRDVRPNEVTKAQTKAKRGLIPSVAGGSC